MNNASALLSALLVGLTFMAIVMETNNGMLFYVAVMISIVILIASFFSKSTPFKLFSVLLFPSLIFLWFGLIELSHQEGLAGENKLEKIVSRLTTFKRENGSYPKTLKFLPSDLQSTFIGISLKPINLYEYTDSSFKVGWDYNYRIYYESHYETFYEGEERYQPQIINSLLNKK